MLRTKAEQQDEDIHIVASQLLAKVLKWEAQDSAEAIKGIQNGLDDFEAGQFGSFDDFATEQQQKYGLSE
ncbi:MAG: hypothetical protein F6K29_34110 [Okeania sp. SIO2G5]|nr:hypothetical protein [Okeania sp. SIO2G5]